MAMKQLQNNFTTPEQSKWLLELGVPADSADCYCMRENPNRLCILNDGATISKLRLRLHMSHIMPIWSVGRLMEIVNICVPSDEELAFTYYDDMIDGLIERIKEERVDFLKLEE